MPARAMLRRAAVVAAASTVLAGCANAATSPSLQTPIPLASAWQPGLLVDGHGPKGLGPSTAPSDTTLEDPTQSALASVLVATSDLAGGATVALAADGTSLSGKSLNYCSASFPSEDARQARRRVEVLDSAGQRVGITSEAVLYATPTDAQNALSELRAAQRSCPSPRTLTVSAHTLVVTQTASDDISAAQLVAAAERVFVSTSVHDTTASVTYGLKGVYQVRGRVLVDVVDSSAGADFTTPELETLHTLTSDAATRLAALDPAFAQPS